MTEPAKTPYRPTKPKVSALGVRMCDCLKCWEPAVWRISSPKEPGYSWLECNVHAEESLKRHYRVVAIGNPPSVYRDSATFLASLDDTPPRSGGYAAGDKTPDQLKPPPASVTTASGRRTGSAPTPCRPLDRT